MDKKNPAELLIIARQKYLQARDKVLGAERVLVHAQKDMARVEQEYHDALQEFDKTYGGA